MYACDLFKANFLDDWKESDDKSLEVTHPHFTKQYTKDHRKLTSNKSNKSYEISEAFKEMPLPHTIEAPSYGSTTTTADKIFAAAMEYAAALEKKTHTQAKCIFALKASVDGHTVLAKATKYAASVVTSGGNNKYLK